MILIESLADKDPGAIYYHSASLFAYKNHEEAPPILNLNVHKINNKIKTTYLVHSCKCSRTFKIERLESSQTNSNHQQHYSYGRRIVKI